jgi:hypothetical protein
MHYPKQKTLVYGLSFLALVCWSGCGTSEYEQRLQNSISNLNSGSEFNELLDPVTVPGTTLTVQLPKEVKTDDGVLWSEFKPLGSDADAARLKPGPLEIPGLKATYEALLLVGNKSKIPCYLYVAEIPATETAAQRVTNDISGKLQNASTNQTFSGKTREGRSVLWQKIHGTAVMDFVGLDPQGKPEKRSLKGICDVLYRTSGGQLIILAWRAPEDQKILEATRCDAWLPLVAGTLGAAE